ncbi:hypothetical protein, partial [Deinococcus xianganensis]|uniref:hypothetical protein n=1 Tax=Deinococcus xianganensis TaxID=1507289 RepID=UPI001F29A69F
MDLKGVVLAPGCNWTPLRRRPYGTFRNGRAVSPDLPAQPADGGQVGGPDGSRRLPLQLPLHGVRLLEERQVLQGRQAL